MGSPVAMQGACCADEHKLNARSVLALQQLLCTDVCLPQQMRCDEYPIEWDAS